MGILKELNYDKKCSLTFFLCVYYSDFSLTAGAPELSKDTYKFLVYSTSTYPIEFTHLNDGSDIEHGDSIKRSAVIGTFSTIATR